MIQVSGVLLVQNGEYVVQKRDNIPNIAEPGVLAPWGGHTEGSETWQETAVRELEEETGVVVRQSDLILLTDYIVEGRSPRSLGKPVHVYLAAVELPADVEVQCFEGEGLRRITSAPDPADSSDFLIKAIEIYEAKTR